jgi:hypothetical protein
MFEFIDFYLKLSCRFGGKKEMKIWGQFGWLGIFMGNEREKIRATPEHRSGFKKRWPRIEL